MIVIGYSADEYGDAAVQHGIAEAKVRGAALLVINASRGDALADPRFAAEGQVLDLQEVLNASGLEYELEQPVGVDIVDALLAAMDRDDAELLVIGIRHRTPVGKLLLGSNSQKLLLRCAKPVLAVKPPE